MARSPKAVLQRDKVVVLATEAPAWPDGYVLVRDADLKRWYKPLHRVLRPDAEEPVTRTRFIRVLLVRRDGMADFERLTADGEVLPSSPRGVDANNPLYPLSPADQHELEVLMAKKKEAAKTTAGGKERTRKPSAVEGCPYAAGSRCETIYKGFVKNKSVEDVAAKVVEVHGGPLRSALFTTRTQFHRLRNQFKVAGTPAEPRGPKAKAKGEKPAKPRKARAAPAPSEEAEQPAEEAVS